MRVLVLHGYGLSGSGSAIYTLDLIRALAESGHDVDLVCHEPDLARQLPRALRVLFAPGITRSCQRIGDRTVQVHAVADRQVPVMYERPELQAGRVITSWSGEELDSYAEGMSAFLETIAGPHGWDAILVNHVAGLCVVADAWSERYGTPWTAIVHGTGLLYGLPHAPLRERVVRSLTSCQNVVVLNQEVRRRVEEAFGAHCPTLREVPPGVDTRRFRRANTAPSPRQVAYAGRLILDKGVHHLLLAWPEVLRRTPDATLKIAGAGADGPVLRAAFEDLCRRDVVGFARRITAHARSTGRADLVAHIEAACSRVEISELEALRLVRSVTWCGPLNRDQVADLFGSSVTAVLPAVVPEAFPLAVLEATAAGAVPIGTELSGLGWLLTRLEHTAPPLASRLIARTDTADPVGTLVERVASVLETPELRAHMDRKPRRFAEQYEWRAIAQRLVAATIPPSPSPTRTAAP